MGKQPTVLGMGSKVPIAPRSSNSKNTRVSEKYGRRFRERVFYYSVGGLVNVETWTAVASLDSVYCRRESDVNFQDHI